MLSKLMEYIAAEEERAKKEGAEEDGAEEDDGRPPVCSSFSPKPYPENVSHVPLSEEEITKIEEARDATGRCRAKEATRRYLPCHYFDYICGSSTGA